LPNSEFDILTKVRDHAWDWFSLHANQRMQTVNFFLISTTFLLAAYGALLEKYHLAAMVVALMGAWATVWFSVLDIRTKALIKAGEKALQACEALMVSMSGIHEIEIIRQVENPRHRLFKYSTAFNAIEWSIGVIFVAGAVYAAVGVK
jgi:hypothetical protein